MTVQMLRAICSAYSVCQRSIDVPLLAVGSEAASNLLGVDNLSKWHGHISRNAEGRLVGVTYHPSSVRNRASNPSLPHLGREIVVCCLLTELG